MTKRESERLRHFGLSQERLYFVRWSVVQLVMGVMLVMCLALPLETWRLWLFVGIVVFVQCVVLPRMKRAVLGANALELFQKMTRIDVLLHGIFVLLTGGVDSPIYPILLMAPLFAGILWRDFKRAWPTAFLATVAIGLIAFLQWWGIVAVVPGYSGATSLFSLWGHSLVMACFCWMGMILATHFSALFEQAAEQLDQVQEEIIRHHREQWQNMEAMTRQMAHEVKNPLTAIKGLTQLMIRNDGNARHATVIAKEVERLRTTLDGYLSMSWQPTTPKTKPVMVEAFLRDTIRVFGARFAQKGIEVSFLELPQREIRLSPHRMKQVFYNLWLNAIEAFDEFDPEAEGKARYINISGGIEARGEDDVEGVALCIQDNGPGFSHREPELARLLRPNVTTKTDGSGLGLAICLNIVEAHGGSLTLHHAPAGGAEIRIWLPLQPLPRGSVEPNNPDVGHAPAESSAPVALSDEPPTPSGTSLVL